MKTINPIYFLLCGILTITAAHTSFSIDLFGWIAYVPFLVYLQRTEGYKSRLLFLLGLILSWSVCISKIVSPPMPIAMVFLYAVPISLVQLPAYLMWDRFKNKRFSILFFPMVMVILEWLQYTFTPLGSWGIAAYSQIHTTSVLQVVSLFGMPGLSFLIYWVNGSIAEMLTQKKTTLLTFQLPIAVTAVLLTFGALRIEFSKAKGEHTIKVAAVGSDSNVQGFPLPSRETNRKVKQNLFHRTSVAARSGAKLVVWNEAATFIFPEEEEEWRDSLSALSGRNNVSLVASYIVPTSDKPVHYENKYIYFDSEGKEVYSYHKHQPVPGEPATKGTEELKVFNLSGVKTGAAICYDYDFPYLAKEFGDLHADLVALPSSDWRGIDPLHTRMAALRAIEQGHSIVRSTRFGLSAAITPYGEQIAQMSSFDSNDKIMLANLPVQHVTTLYSIIGDCFILLGLVFIVFFLLYQGLSRRVR